MSPQSLADDLAYIRDLAEGGQRAPLVGGRFLAWWGGTITLAYVGQYLILSRVLDVPLGWIGWMWVLLIVFGYAGFWALLLTFPRSKPGMGSAANRVSSMIWLGGGMTLFAFFTAAFIRAAFLVGSADPFLWSVPFVVGIYGICQLTTGLMGQSKPLIWAGWIAIVSVAAAVLLVGRTEIWLLGAVVAFLTVFLPGIILMRNEPSSTI
jgi:hypothetical protein